MNIAKTRPERPHYRALMLREDARRSLDEALWAFEKAHGFRPTYSTFMHMLVNNFVEVRDGDKG